jgi:hypothetical protein
MSPPTWLLTLTVAWVIYYLFLVKNETAVRARVAARPALALLAPSNEQGRFIMACVVTVLVLPSALYVVLSHSFPEADRQKAWGAIATILAFWLTRQLWSSGHQP